MSINSLRKLAPGVGLEPTTLPLTAACSTIELARNETVGRHSGESRNPGVAPKAWTPAYGLPG